MRAALGAEVPTPPHPLASVVRHTDPRSVRLLLMCGSWMAVLYSTSTPVHIEIVVGDHRGAQPWRPMLRRMGLLSSQRRRTRVYSVFAMRVDWKLFPFFQKQNATDITSLLSLFLSSSSIGVLLFSSLLCLFLSSPSVFLCLLPLFPLSRLLLLQLRRVWPCPREPHARSQSP